MAESEVFTNVQVQQMAPGRAFITWELDPKFPAEPPYVFTVQGGSAGSAGALDWKDLGQVMNTAGGHVQFTDSRQRSWSLVDPYFYRVKITTEGDDYFSRPVTSTWGTIRRDDQLLLNSLIRQVSTYMTAGMGGRRGMLYRRKNWGQLARSVNDDTGAISNPMMDEDFGTGYVGGYHPPFEFCITADPGTDWSADNTALDTTSGQSTAGESARCLAYPIPRSKDVWVDLSTGWRYYVGRVKEITRIRSVSVQLSIELNKAEPTDIIHRLRLPQ